MQYVSSLTLTYLIFACGFLLPYLAMWVTDPVRGLWHRRFLGLTLANLIVAAITVLWNIRESIRAASGT